MDEIYKAIETKIAASGYDKEISGFAVYNEMCDQMEDKENGTYLLLAKQENDDVFEYNVTIMEDDFNLSSLTITTPEGASYFIDFDAE